MNGNEMMIARKTDCENRAHCQRIAKEIESYAAGNVYRCPECGETIQWQNKQYNIDDSTYTCPCCNSEFDESDLEALSLYDYFEDVLDIEYRVGSNKELRSVSLMVACGGPNIYIDTEKKAVLLYWWTDRAEYPLSYDVCDEIDAWAEELWNC